MPFQIGEIGNLSPKDPTFDTYEKAQAAIEAKNWNDGAWGIWTTQEDGSECLAIWFMGTEFLP